MNPLDPTLADLLPLFDPLPPEHQLPHPIVVLDTETTGFPLGMKKGHPDARVIELGAIALGRDGVPTALFQILVKPHRWPSAGLWPSLVEAGLTIDLVEEQGQRWDHAGADIRFWWPEANATTVPAAQDAPRTFAPWVAFNAPFDRDILAQSRLSPPESSISAPKCIMLAAMDCMDAANALPRWPARRGQTRGEAKWPTADEALSFLGIDFPHPHRALPDAIGEALILTTLARRGWAPWR